MTDRFPLWPPHEIFSISTSFCLIRQPECPIFHGILKLISLEVHIYYTLLKLTTAKKMAIISLVIRTQSTTCYVQNLVRGKSPTLYMSSQEFDVSITEMLAV